VYREEVARRLVQILVKTKVMFHFRVDCSRHKEYLVGFKLLTLLVPTD
jgi:hypothetical protein